MKRNPVILATTLLFTGFAFAQSQSATQSTAASADQSKPAAAKASTKADDMFAKKAAAGGLAEVQLGQLAQQKSQNPDVKAFGQRMVTDHTKANDQLKGVAGQENLTLPTELDAKDKALQARLEKLSGPAFDKAYINAMVRDHKKDVAEFEHEASNGKDDGIKNFASQTLPTLQDHLKQALDVQTKVRASNATAGTSTNASAAKP